MKIIKTYNELTNSLRNLESIPLLAIRLVLAYGFYEPAKNKWANIDGIATWFESLSYPLPKLNAYLAATTEALGVLLLLVGLGSRIISIPLMFVMLIAIFTVHWSNGFAAGDNGFEIPLYYFIMLFTLVIFGSGKFSLDYLLKKYIK
jgi:putative oxidoreductase